MGIMDKERSAYTNPAGGELARIGRILMDKAATTKDDALSNVLGRVGDELTMYGDSGGAQSMEELIKRTNVKKEHLMKLIKWAKEQTDTSQSKVKDPTDAPTDESGIMYKAGVKKYGKDGMTAIQSAAGKGASAEEIGRIKDKHNKKKESIETESTPIGHTDDERNMLRKNLYQLAVYAKETFGMLENLPADADFPHWWQAKVVNSLALMSKAKHYLENEINVPDVDGDRTEEDAVNEEHNIRDAIKSLFDEYVSKASDDELADLYHSMVDKIAKKESICPECSKPRFVAMPEEIQAQYEAVNEEKQKGIDGKVCWKGYKRMGTKMKGGKRVDNCVKIKK